MRSRVRVATVAGAIVIGLLSLVSSPPALAGTYKGFADPQQVTLSGYAGSAMEPDISPDGEYLLFNSSNVAPNIPELEVATRTGPSTFRYDGPLPGEGVNEPGQLSGTPSLDRESDLYFVSPRSYGTTLQTVYTGRFEAGSVTGVHLVEGISGGEPGMVDFDVAVSPSGESIFVSVGDYRTGSLSEAHLALYQRSGTGFLADPASTRLLRAVNSAGTLDYAAAVSSNELELFFTRATPSEGATGLPAIYRATRSRPSKPFGHVKRVGAISGFAEAPSLSDDGSTLYYHALLEGVFRIFSVTRQPT